VHIFRWSTITKPLPRHIALWWVLGAALLLVYTVVKFYLLKVWWDTNPI
jgi:hypothetical protein